MANWPKYDPRTGFWLCENCWNRGNWSHHCTLGMCECPKKGCCSEEKQAAKVKFTGEGQTKITDLELGPPIVIEKGRT